MKATSMHRMTQRVQGLVFIVWGLLPMALIAAIIICMLSIVGDVKGFVIVPMQTLGQVLAEVKENARKTGETIGNAIDPLTRANHRVADALQAVGNISTQVAVPAIRIPDANLPVSPRVQVNNGVPSIHMTTVRVPMPTVPGFSLSVESLQHVQEVLQDNLGILGDLTSITKHLPNLHALRAHSQTVDEAAHALLSGATRIGLKMLMIMIFAAVIVVPWAVSTYVTPYARWSLGWLKAGWKLLTGSPVGPKDMVRAI